MGITTYSNFCQNLKNFLDLVLKTKAPLFVTRNKSEDIVVISKSDYESIQETLYLLNSSKNSERLARGIQEHKEGKGVKGDLID